MTNSSSLFNAAAAMSAAAVLGLAAGLTDGGWLAPAAALASVTALFQLRQVGRALDRTLTALEDAAAGRLDARLVGWEEGGRLGRIKLGINRLLDLTEAFTKEADAAMEMSARGRYFRHILTDGMLGEFSRHAGLINAALSGMAERSRDFSIQAHEVGESVRGAVRDAGATAALLEETARQLTGESGRAAVRAAKVTEAAGSAARRIADMSAAAQQAYAASRDVAGRIRHSAQLSDEALNAADAALDTVRRLSDAGTRIGAFADLIAGVAGKTNLLALNASIEAARAGDAGKGFAVVAGEVKALADQTARATADIGAQLAAMAEAVDSTLQSVDGVEAMIRRIDDNAAAIAVAADQQTTGVAAISAAMRDAAGEVDVIAVSIAEVSAIVADADHAAQAVLAAAGRLATGAAATETDLDAFIAKVSGAERAGGGQ